MEQAECRRRPRGQRPLARAAPEKQGKEPDGMCALSAPYAVRLPFGRPPGAEPLRRNTQRHMSHVNRDFSVQCAIVAPETANKRRATGPQAEHPSPANGSLRGMKIVFLVTAVAIGVVPANVQLARANDSAAEL